MAYKNRQHLANHKALQIEPRDQYLKSLGYASAPFEARFDGKCPITGTKYYRGSSVAYFLAYDKPIPTIVIDTYIRNRDQKGCAQCGLDAIRDGKCVFHPEAEVVSYLTLCERAGLDPFGLDSRRKLVDVSGISATDRAKELLG